jgi:hypothetical protein
MAVARFYGDILLVTLRNLEDSSLLVRRDCVLLILSIALRTWLPSRPTSTAKRAIPSYRLNTRISKYSPITNFHIASIYSSKNVLLKCEEREKTNKMQQSDVYYQLLSQHVSGIIMSIFRRTKKVCYCIRCTALVLLDVVGSGCGALLCRMRALLVCNNTLSLFS